MQFLYVRSVVCLQLPSDPASRRTTLALGYVLGATPCTRDFHPLERAHAERTNKAPVFRRGIVYKSTVLKLSVTQQILAHSR